MPFARGAKAWGMCDRCGQRYFLKQLNIDPYTRLKLCPICIDPVPQQSWPPYPTTTDPVALENPRPDPDGGVQPLYDSPIPPGGGAGDGNTLLKDVIDMTHGDT